MSRTTKVITHDIRPIMEDRYNDYRPSTMYGSRVFIEGAENGFAGYGVGLIPKGHMARQESYGPLVPGPWAYTFGLCTVIDNHGGTSADVAREKAAQRHFTVKAGDKLRLSDTVTVRVSLDARRYPVLTFCRK